MWQTYYTPTSVDEALRLLAEHGPEARIIAGGTDLLIELQRGVRQARVLIDVTRIYNLDQVQLDGDGLVHVGPTVTHNLAYASDLLVERGFPLALACCRVGTPQLRNRGTIAGNLITASPANDTITALWALDGRLTLQSARGEHTLSCAEFYQGVRQTALAPDEMLTDIAELLEMLDQEKKQQRGLVDALTIDLAQLAGGVAGDGSGLRIASVARGIQMHEKSAAPQEG